MARTRLISAELTSALDAARATAAFYVVLHHVANAYGFSNGPGIIFRFGQEAVIAFFLLSGFVIFANERVRAIRPKGYALRRLRRIYPPVLAAIAISTIVFILNDDFSNSFEFKELLATVFSVQDISFLKPGTIADPYLGNDPLWSLSYEVFFYFLFPLILPFFNKNPNITSLTIGLMCCGSFLMYIAIPNHFFLVGSYSLVWWMGAMVAKAYLEGHRSIMAVMDVYFYLLVLCGFAAFAVYLMGFETVGKFPFLMLRHFLFAALLVFVFFGPLGRLATRLLYPFRRLALGAASISYGVYVLHFPILIQWDFASTPLGFVSAIALLLLASYAVERLLPKILPAAPKT